MTRKSKYWHSSADTPVSKCENMQESSNEMFICTVICSTSVVALFKLSRLTSFNAPPENCYRAGCTTAAHRRSQSWARNKPVHHTELLTSRENVVQTNIASSPTHSTSFMKEPAVQGIQVDTHQVEDIRTFKANNFSATEAYFLTRVGYFVRHTFPKTYMSITYNNFHICLL